MPGSSEAGRAHTGAAHGRSGGSGVHRRPAAVHLPERGGGDGGEHQRVLRHRLGDGLPASDAGADQVEGVRGVDPGAGRALGRAAVPAPHVGDPERLAPAGVGREDLAGNDIDGLGVAVQPDRPRAVPHPGQRLGPGVEARGDQPVPDLELHLFGDRGEVQRRVLAVAGEHGREQGGRVSVTAALVLVLTGLTTLRGVPRG
jgi:hypothetical protein